MSHSTITVDHSNKDFSLIIPHNFPLNFQIWSYKSDAEVSFLDQRFTDLLYNFSSISHLSLQPMIKKKKKIWLIFFNAVSALN